MMYDMRILQLANTGLNVGSLLCSQVFRPPRYPASSDHWLTNVRSRKKPNLLSNIGFVLIDLFAAASMTQCFHGLDWAYT